MRNLLLTAAALFYPFCTAIAAEIPKSAKPLAQSETYKLFNDHTIRIRHEGHYIRDFYGSNGNMIGIRIDAKKKFVYSGKWSVRGNRMCHSSIGKELTSQNHFSVRDCVALYRLNGKIVAYVVVEHAGEPRLKNKQITITFINGNTIASEHASLK